MKSLSLSLSFIILYWIIVIYRSTFIYGDAHIISYMKTYRNTYIYHNVNLFCCQLDMCIYIIDILIVISHMIH